MFLVFAVTAQAELWDNATKNNDDDGWKSSSWLGLFHSDSNGPGWIYHQDLGWLYAEGTDETSIWFYWPNQGWFWTGESLFPFVWGSQHSGWHYYYTPVGTDSQSSLWFYNFTSADWTNGIVFRPDSLDGETLVIDTSSSPGHVEASYTFGSSTYTASLKRSQLGMTIPIEISGTYFSTVDADNPETIVCNLTIDQYRITMATIDGPATIDGTAEEVAATTGLPVTTAATVTLTATGSGVGTYEVGWTYTNGLADSESGNLSW